MNFLRPRLAVRTALLLYVVTAGIQLHADISLPKIFTDNMVLQQKSEIEIYGTAEPGQTLIVQLANQSKQATAGPDGKWRTVLKTGTAGGPHELTVTAEAGQPQVKVSNVMFGEVWLCSGQSNMEWPVAKSLNSKTEIEQSINYPNIRLFTVERNASMHPLDQFDKVSGWKVCSPDSVGSFSGVGYFFARELSKKFPDVPIGLINASWGGTSAEAWTQRSALEAVDSLKPMIEHWDAIVSEGDKNRPSVLFNGMISPLSRYSFRGVLWYQGERNNGRGQQYATLFPALIANWREYFGQPEMPFYFVQLAPFRYGNHPPEALAEIWEAQAKTHRETPHTGMVVTTDIANINDIHPKNKQEVGRRLSLIAQANVYNQWLPEGQREVAFSGPVFEKMSTNGQRVRLTFKHAEGLSIRSNEEALSCFEVAGADGKFYPAKAEIVGQTVELESADVTQPQAVRFGWNDTAQPNLVNGVGLPAAPFRTDDQPLISAGRDF